VLRKQILKFLLVGMINTIVYYALYSFFIYLGINYKLAVLFATLLGILFSFKTFSIYVFQEMGYKVFVKFILVYTILYFVNIYLISILEGNNIYLAGIIAIVPVSMLTFILNKWYVFNRKVIINGRNING